MADSWCARIEFLSGICIYNTPELGEGDGDVELLSHTVEGSSLQDAKLFSKVVVPVSLYSIKVSL